MKINKDLFLKIAVPALAGVVCWIGGGAYAKHKVSKKHKISLLLDNSGEAYLSFKDRETFNEVTKMDFVVCKVVHTNQTISYGKPDGEDTHTA